jgi:thiol-disulfide isomerase/thioredoxin
MKKALYLSLILMASCDIIEHPVLPFSINYREDLYGPPPVFEAATDFGQNVLIEDFTAHKCGNCPDAAVIAEALFEEHPEDIVLIGIHAGSLADYSTEPFTTNWIVPEGDYFWNQLDFQANPLGRVNRLGGPGNFFAPTVWGDEASQLMQESSSLGLQMVASYDASQSNLNIHVNGQFSAEYPGATHLVVLITESHMIDYQLWYNHDPEIVPDYEFNHVLRGSVSGPEGLGFSENASAGTVIQKDYTIGWNANWDPANSHVVAIVYSDETGEVVNVLQVDVE